MRNDFVRLIDVKTDDITDYGFKSILLAFPYCSGKCRGCQNKHLNFLPTKIYYIKDIIELYKKNPSHHGLVFAGLEPFDSFEDLKSIIKNFCDIDEAVDFVIYTGYTLEEIKDKKYLQNILEIFNEGKIINKKLFIKFGRYEDLNIDPWFSQFLQVNLITKNQEVLYYDKYYHNYNEIIIESYKGNRYEKMVL